MFFQNSLDWPLHDRRKLYNRLCRTLRAQTRTDMHSGNPPYLQSFVGLLPSHHPVTLLESDLALRFIRHLIRLRRPTLAGHVFNTFRNLGARLPIASLANLCMLAVVRRQAALTLRLCQRISKQVEEEYPLYLSTNSPEDLDEWRAQCARVLERLIHVCAEKEYCDAIISLGRVLLDPQIGIEVGMPTYRAFLRAIFAFYDPTAIAKEDQLTHLRRVSNTIRWAQGVLSAASMSRPSGEFGAGDVAVLLHGLGKIMHEHSLGYVRLPAATWKTLAEILKSLSRASKGTGEIEPAFAWVHLYLQIEEGRLALASKTKRVLVQHPTMKAPYWKPVTHPPETRDVPEEVMELVRGTYERAMELLSEWEQMFNQSTLREPHSIAQKGQILQIHVRTILIAYSRPPRTGKQRPKDPFEPVHAILQRILALRSQLHSRTTTKDVSQSHLRRLYYIAQAEDNLTRRFEATLIRAISHCVSITTAFDAHSSSSNDDEDHTTNSPAATRPRPPGFLDFLLSMPQLYRRAQYNHSLPGEKPTFSLHPAEHIHGLFLFLPLTAYLRMDMPLESEERTTDIRYARRKSRKTWLRLWKRSLGFMIKYSSWDGFAAMGQAEGEGLDAWFGLLRGLLDNIPKELVLRHAHRKRLTVTPEEENQVFKLLIAQRVLPRGCILQTLRVALGLPYRAFEFENRFARVQSPPDPANAEEYGESESEVSRVALDYFAREVELVLGNPKEAPKLIAALTWPGNVVRLDEWQEHMQAFGVPVQSLVEWLKGSADIG